MAASLSVSVHAAQQQPPIKLCFEASAPMAMQLGQHQNRQGYAIDLLTYVYQTPDRSVDTLVLSSLEDTQLATQCEILIQAPTAPVPSPFAAMRSLVTTQETHWALYDKYHEMIRSNAKDPATQAHYPGDADIAAGNGAPQAASAAPAVEPWFEALLDQRVDTLRINAITAEYTIAKNGWTGKFKQLPPEHPSFKTQTVRIAPALNQASARAAALKQQWESALQTLISTGRIAEFFSPYAIEDAPLVFAQ